MNTNRLFLTNRNPPCPLCPSAFVGDLLKLSPYSLFRSQAARFGSCFGIGKCQKGTENQDHNNIAGAGNDSLKVHFFCRLRINKYVQGGGNGAPNHDIGDNLNSVKYKTLLKAEFAFLNPVKFGENTNCAAKKGG